MGSRLLIASFTVLVFTLENVMKLLIEGTTEDVNKDNGEWFC